MDTVRKIHEQNGLAILPHPFHLYVGRTAPEPRAANLLPNIPFDGIESINHGDALSFLGNRPVQKLLQKFKLAAIGSSDAHDSAFVGMACTLFHGQTPDDLKKAIGTQKTQACYFRSWTFKDIVRQLKGSSEVLTRFMQSDSFLKSKNFF